MGLTLCVLVVGREETKRRVLSLSEVLAILSAQALGKMPARVCERGIRLAGGGSATRVSETYDMFKACCDLLDYYDDAGQR